ncbi:hypothetical protein ACFY05_32070 [Microtetraspora fusca]|uniref:Uncharacterized protein n=1 Tax=Microtetraspora fusca TaxID=1997 RepID=A0ABW6VGY5_MICFU
MTDAHTPALDEAFAAAHTAFMDGTLEAVPVMERLDTALWAFLKALTSAGYVNDPSRQPTPEELDQAAQWLAEVSRFPRYCDGDGWRHLRQHPTDIEIAVNKALALAGPGEEDLLARLNLAKYLLIAHTTHGGEV